MSFDFRVLFFVWSLVRVGGSLSKIAFTCKVQGWRWLFGHNTLLCLAFAQLLAAVRPPSSRARITTPVLAANNSWQPMIHPCRENGPGPANQVKSSALSPLFKFLQRRLPGNHSLGSHDPAFDATVDLDSANGVYGSSASESVPNASLSTVVLEKFSEKRGPGSGVCQVREITV